MVPSKIARGTPLMPPFKSGLVAGAVVVTFTDIADGSEGRSRGNGPCSKVIRLNAAAISLISGFRGARSEG